MSDAPNPPSGSEVTIDGVTWRFTPGGMLEPNEWRSQSGHVAHYAHHVALNRVSALEEKLRALLGPTASLTVDEVIQIAARTLEEAKKKAPAAATVTLRQRVWYVTDCTGLPVSAEWETEDQAKQSARALNAAYPNNAPHLVSFRYV